VYLSLAYIKRYLEYQNVHILLFHLRAIFSEPGYSHTRIAHDILNHAFELNSNFLTGKNIPLVGLELLFVFYGKKLGCELTYRNCLLSHLTHALLILGKHNLTGVMVTSQHVMLI